jgi:hypothetical protein
LILPEIVYAQFMVFSWYVCLHTFLMVWQGFVTKVI